MGPRDQLFFRKWGWAIAVAWTLVVSLALWWSTSHVKKTIRELEQMAREVSTPVEDYRQGIRSHQRAEILAHGSVWAFGLVLLVLGVHQLKRRQREREEVEAAARKTEKRSQLFFDRQVVPMAITSPQKGWVQVNDHLCSLFGYTREELSQLTWAELTHPEDLERDLQYFERLRDGTIDDYSTEKRYIRKDGTVIDTHLSVSSVRRPDGTLEDVLAVIEDISARKRAEAALRESERKYRELIENANSIILRWTSRGEITFLNEFGQKFFGWTQAELLGRSVMGTIVPESESTGRDLRPLMDQVCNNPKAFESNVNENILRDGRRVWVAWTNKTVFDSAGKLVEVLSIGTDITERKRAEEALAESEARYRMFFEANPHPMWLYDLETLAFLAVNDAAVCHYGYSRPEFLSMTIADIRPSDDVPRLLENVARGNDDPIERSGIWRHRKKDGTVIWAEISSHALQYRGRPAKLVLAHDVTEQKRAEQEQQRLLAQLIQAQKMEAVGQLAGGVAHDFNNILAAMMMQVGLLQMNPHFPPEFGPALADLEAEATRAANLTRQLLTFSRRQIMQPQVFDVNALLSNLLRMLKRLIGEHIRLDLKCAGEELWVNADPGMMEQVVVNLAVNARDAMPNGGSLLLKTEPRDLEETSIHGNPDAAPGRFVCLCVSDTGCGMDANTLKHIFEPFFTTKEPGKGTGLGLATVYGILKQHNGWVQVESQPHRGSTFRVFLPFHPKAPAKPDDLIELEQDSTPGGDETVLVVEDEASVRATIVKTLRNRGYRVLEAVNGNEALRVWRQQPGTVDLLLTDMVLPEGLTGLQLAQQLRRDSQHLKVLLMSGYNLELAQHGLPIQPGIKYLAKPFSGRLLSEAVRGCLNPN